MKMNEARMNNLKGACYLSAIGDSMGATTELMNKDEIRMKYGEVTELIGGGWLKLEPGQITDDTQMTMCIFDSVADTYYLNDLWETKPGTLTNYVQTLDILERLLEWKNTNPIDIGSATKHNLNEIESRLSRREVARTTSGKISVLSEFLAEENYSDLGNGALMRSLPCVLLDSHLPMIMQGKLTHNNDIQSCCLYIYYSILKMMLCDEDASISKVYIKNHIQNLGNDLAAEFGIKELYNIGEKHMIPSGHVINTLNNALYWFFSKFGMVDSIIACVNDGGDADTIACVLGAIAGMYCGFKGIKYSWIDSLDESVVNSLDINLEMINRFSK